MAGHLKPESKRTVFRVMIPGILQATVSLRPCGRSRFRAESRPTGRAWPLMVALIVMSSINTPSEARQTAEELDVHAERVMIRGLTWLQNGYPDRAAAVFEEGLKVHPSNAALLSTMSTAQKVMGDLGTARFYLEQALERAPGLPSLVEQDLNLSLASGDLEATGIAVNRLLELEDLDARFAIQQLSSLMDQGATDLGRDLAVEFMGRFPEDLEVTLSVLTVFISQGNRPASIQAAQRIVDLRGSFDDRFILARELMRDAQWPEAVVVLEPMVREDPGESELVAMMAELDARLPERDLAAELGLEWTVAEGSTETVVSSDSLSILRTAWQEQPDVEERVVRLATFLMRMGEAREAALLVDEHNAQYPRHLRVWTLTIQTWLAAGDLETATQRADDASLLFPGYAPIVIAHARVLAARGDNMEAIQMIETLIGRLDAQSEYLGVATAMRIKLQQPQ